MPAEGKGEVGILRPYKQGLLALGMRTEGKEMERLSQQVRYQKEETENSKGLEGVGGVHVTSDIHGECTEMPHKQLVHRSGHRQYWAFLEGSG